MMNPIVHRGSLSIWYALPLLFVSLSWLGISSAAPRSTGAGVWSWPLIHLIRCMRPGVEDNVPPMTPIPQTPTPLKNSHGPGGRE